MLAVFKTKEYWILFVLLFGAFEPEVIRNGLMLPWLDSLFDIISLFVATIVVYAFLKRKIKLTPVSLSVIALAAIFCLATILSNGSLSKFRYFWLSPIMAFFLMSLSIQKKPYVAARALADYLLLLLLINLGLALMSPEGCFRDGETGAVYFFLDHKNRIIFHYLAGFGAALVVDFIQKTKWYVAIYSIVGLATFLIVDSSTSLVVFITMLLLVMVASRSNLSPVLNIATLSALIAIVFLVVVMLRGQIPLMSWFVEDVLGKSMTFTGRTEIWDSALELIGEKPVFGHGIQLSESTMIVARDRVWPHAHDVYLNILYQGGVAAFISFLLSFILCVKGLYVMKKETLAMVLSLVIFAYLLEFVFDVADFSGFYCILAFASNIDLIQKATVAGKVPIIDSED